MIVGCLSWFDEDPGDLRRSVASAAAVCDHVVAVDGRWALFPGDAHASSRDQRDAVLDAAASAGASATVVVPSAPWPGDGPKRQHAFRAAVAAGADWLLQFDADEEVECDDAGALRAHLAQTAANVVGVWRFNDPPAAPGQEAHSDVAERWMGWLIRGLPAIEVVPPSHFTFRSGSIDLSLPEETQPWLRLRHRTTARPAGRQSEKADYLALRAAAGEC